MQDTKSLKTLKPCPFCGGSEIRFRSNPSRGGRFYYVECAICGARTRGVCIPNEELPTTDEFNNRALDLVEVLWNRRSDGDA